MARRSTGEERREQADQEYRLAFQKGELLKMELDSFGRSQVERHVVRPSRAARQIEEERKRGRQRPKNCGGVSWLRRLHVTLRERYRRNKMAPLSGATSQLFGPTRGDLAADCRSSRDL